MLRARLPWESKTNSPRLVACFCAYVMHIILSFVLYGLYEKVWVNFFKAMAVLYHAIGGLSIRGEDLVQVLKQRQHSIRP